MKRNDLDGIRGERTLITPTSVPRMLRRNGTSISCVLNSKVHFPFHVKHRVPVSRETSNESPSKIPNCTSRTETFLTTQPHPTAV
ncbi:Uncharacterised protein [Mycobacteroides abscessus subsp. abscessus]|nr:Uncharacterised protein [Mycobacteroides abscessus subsp. abscessus]